jgi:hypothetical protein
MVQRRFFRLPGRLSRRRLWSLRTLLGVVVTTIAGESLTARSKGHEHPRCGPDARGCRRRPRTVITFGYMMGAPWLVLRHQNASYDVNPGACRQAVTAPDGDGREARRAAGRAVSPELADAARRQQTVQVPGEEGRYGGNRRKDKKSEPRARANQSTALISPTAAWCGPLWPG